MKLSLPLERLQYWLLSAVLLVIGAVGAVGTPDFAAELIPQFYWNNQAFWTARQSIYSRRDLHYTSGAVAFLRELLAEAEIKREIPMDDPHLNTALRKMVARRQRAIEKDNLLNFKVERILRQRAEALGEVRQQQHMEGF